MNIKRVSNGYVVEHDDESEKIIEVAEIGDSRMSECRAIQNALYFVMEGLGHINSKHDVYRVRVIVVNENGEEVDEDGHPNPED
jgi:hypothetical protein